MVDRRPLRELFINGNVDFARPSPSPPIKSAAPTLPRCPAPIPRPRLNLRESHFILGSAFFSLWFSKTEWALMTRRQRACPARVANMLSVPARLVDLTARKYDGDQMARLSRGFAEICPPPPPPSLQAKGYQLST